jgi:putative phosphoribosyl transferase
MRFRDRGEAGRQLADRLVELDLTDPVVLGLARGGLPVAAQIAARLHAPVEVFVARKVGAPGHEELGIGAVAEGFEALVVTDTAGRLGLDRQRIGVLAERARQEVTRRVETYRNGRGLPQLTGRDVILVDDGLATGVTAEAALRALRARRPRTLILAVPACAREAATRLAAIADQVICVLTATDFFAVGQWYEDFGQISDAEVVQILDRGRAVATGRSR